MDRTGSGMDGTPPTTSARAATARSGPQCHQSCSVVALAQVADHAGVELALDQADHAVDLVDGDLEPDGEPAVGRGDQGAAGALQPARGGCAVDAERGADLVDRQ